MHNSICIHIYRSIALALVLLTVAMPARAGEVCDIIDNDPNTENPAISTASGDFATACGFANTASGESAVAFGSSNNASGNFSVAFGLGGSAKGTGSMVFGSWFDADGDGLVAPFIDVDMDGVLDASRELTTAFGDHSTAIGPGAWSIGQRAAAFGAGAFAQADDSIALGSDSFAGEANTVSVGSVGNERRIVNVAAGTAATDAANLSQLQAGLESTLNTAKAYTDTAVATGGTAANAYTDNRETEIRQDMDAGDAQTLSAANAYTDQKFANLDFSGINDRFDAIEQRLGRQDLRIDRNGAMAAAMMNMGTNIAGTTGRRGRLAVGAGFQGGERALSIGYGKRVGARGSFSLGGAFSGSEKSAGVGFGVEL